MKSLIHSLESKVAAKLDASFRRTALDEYDNEHRTTVIAMGVNKETLDNQEVASVMARWPPVIKGDFFQDDVANR